MDALDVEALLDSTAAEKKNALASETPKSYADDGMNEKADRRDIDRPRNRERDRDRERNSDRRDSSRDRHRKRRERSPLRSRPVSSSSKDATPARSEAGSHRSRRRSRSREDRRPSRRYRGDRDRERDRDGDYYRGLNRGGRSRSRSPDRRWRRGGGRDRDDRRSYHDDRQRPRGGGGGDDSRRNRREPTPPLNEDERDRRTVFVQQLAARLRTKELKVFFEQAGNVVEAQIVKDRVSLRSKGVGYVEFKDEEAVQAALQLTGQKLLGIPVIVQLTEAEKNRQVRNPEGNANAVNGNNSNGNGTGANGNSPHQAPFHRLYVGNIHFSITESDLKDVFEAFGELEFVQLQKDETGRSRGYGFVQFREADQAKEALEQMNGFDLAGRPIRVGLGNDKFTPESTANLLQKFQGQNQTQYQGSAFSGAGGRGQQAPNFDRAGGRDSDKTGGASALDDTDVAGVNFNNYSRDALMRKLARTDEPASNAAPAASSGREEKVILKPKTEAKPMPVNVNMASRCVVLRNMFDPADEEGESWIKELEDDVRQEAEEKYGHVVHIALDPNSQGDIYLKFDKVQGGENAIKGLNGRYFGGRMISAAPVVDAVYSSLFSRTKAF